MNHAIALLRKEIKDLKRRIVVIDDYKRGVQHSMTSAKELPRLDELQMKMGISIDQCQEALKWVIANA